jgi:hypothetical protein
MTEAQEPNKEDKRDDEDDVKAISALLLALRPLKPASRINVLDFVVKQLGIPLAGSQPSPVHSNLATPTAAQPVATLSQPAAPTILHDIRTFAAEKNPRTVNEKVAVIGYYLAHLASDAERRDHLISEDIKRYFIQAGFELPTAPPAVTLAHAKNAGYLNAMERGQFKLNAVGHNLVAHKLPSGTGGDAPRGSASRNFARKKTRRRRKT